MSAATPPPGHDPEASSAGESEAADVSGRRRILDAAIVEFAERGVAATSLKVIAQRADVSQALIVHHFGSKEALRRACDGHVAAAIREHKRKALGQGSGFDPIAALRDVEEQRPLLQYLARTLGDGQPEVAALVDEMIDDAVGYMAEGERSGLVKPSENPRARAAILVLWSLGLLMMHEHVDRHLGVDLLTATTPEMTAYILPAIELLSSGVLTEDMYVQVKTAVHELTSTAESGQDTSAPAGTEEQK